MKVMIAYPSIGGKGSPMLTQNRQFQWMSIGSYIYPMVPASAATLLDRGGHEVVWFDGIAEGLSYRQFLDTVARESPDLLALETKTPVVKLHWSAIDDVKRVAPEVRCVLMGDHVTALPEESLRRSRADFVLTGGDYDVSLRGMADALSGRGEMPAGVYFRNGEGIRNTGPFALDANLNDLPFVDRRLTKADLYYEKWRKRTPFRYTMAGRDCPWGKCSFCSWTTLYPGFRSRTPEHLLDELEMLVETFGVREVFDDTGTFPPGPWLRRFCRGMIDRGLSKQILFSCNMRFDFLVQDPELPALMKKAGFRKIKAGLESANQDTLDRIRKNLRVSDITQGCRLCADAGIDVQLTVMVGYPWERREDASRTVRLAQELMAAGHAEMLQSTVLVPYPGTPLYEEALRNGWLRIREPLSWDRYDMTEPVLETPDMRPEEVMELCSKVYQNFLTPRYMMRQMLRVRSLEDLHYLLRGGRAVLGHILDFARNRASP